MVERPVQEFVSGDTMLCATHSFPLALSRVGVVQDGGYLCAQGWRIRRAHAHQSKSTVASDVVMRFIGKAETCSLIAQGCHCSHHSGYPNSHMRCRRSCDFALYTHHKCTA